MKLVRDENPNWKPWWIGKIGTCNECKFTVELEEQDRNILWLSSRTVSFKCSRCGERVDIYRTEV